MNDVVKTTRRTLGRRNGVTSVVGVRAQPAATSSGDFRTVTMSIAAGSATSMHGGVPIEKCGIKQKRCANTAAKRTGGGRALRDTVRQTVRMPRRRANHWRRGGVGGRYVARGVENAFPCRCLRNAKDTFVIESAWVVGYQRIRPVKITRAGEAASRFTMGQTGVVSEQRHGHVIMKYASDAVQLLKRKGSGLMFIM